MYAVDGGGFEMTLKVMGQTALRLDHGLCHDATGRTSTFNANHGRTRGARVL